MVRPEPSRTSSRIGSPAGPSMGTRFRGIASGFSGTATLMPGTWIFAFDSWDHLLALCQGMGFQAQTNISAHMRLVEVSGTQKLYTDNVGHRRKNAQGPIPTSKSRGTRCDTITSLRRRRPTTTERRGFYLAPLALTLPDSLRPEAYSCARIFLTRFLLISVLLLIWPSLRPLMPSMSK